MFRRDILTVLFILLWELSGEMQPCPTDMHRQVPLIFKMLAMWERLAGATGHRPTMPESMTLWGGVGVGVGGWGGGGGAACQYSNVTRTQCEKWILPDNYMKTFCLARKLQWSDCWISRTIQHWFIIFFQEKKRIITMSSAWGKMDLTQPISHTQCVMTETKSKKSIVLINNF